MTRSPTRVTCRDGVEEEKEAAVARAQRQPWRQQRGPADVQIHGDLTPALLHHVLGLDSPVSRQMCKVESSTDSDSEISPRWSDTSTMGCASSAPESGSFRRVLPLHKPSARHSCYSLFLDPYDGSSEDSEEVNVDGDVSSRRARTQGRGGARFSRRGRRVSLHHPPAVMRSGVRGPAGEVDTRCASDPELWVCELLSQNGLAGSLGEDVEMNGQLDDSGVHTSTPHTDLTTMGQMLSSSSEISPKLRSDQKRKLVVSGAYMLELQHKKRRCVEDMEVMSASEASSSCVAVKMK
ncbi:uncharacterized protein ACB058_017977 isoform 1-T1 [Synchiropus picturatus]